MHKRKYIRTKKKKELCTKMYSTIHGVVKNNVHLS